MWQHLYRYLIRVADYAITMGGTSRFGFFGLLLLPPAISYIEDIWKQLKGGATWVTALGQVRPFSVFRKPVVIIWLCLAIWSFGAVTYQDHMSLVARTRRQNNTQAVEEKPKLTLTIDEWGAGDSTDVHTGYKAPLVVMVASLVNRGSPSTLDEWSLAVTFVDGKHLFIAPAQLSAEGSMRLENGKRGVVSLKDSLYEESSRNPVVKGKKIRGRLMFRFPPSISTESLKAVGTEYLLSCKDIDGQVVSVSKKWTPDMVGKQFGILPGTHWVDPITHKAPD